MGAVHADVQLSGLFSDHMVLQRDKPVAVFGTADAGEKVAVSFNGKTLSTVADAQENWQVLLPPMSANAKGQPMTVAGANSISISDVLVGDVWLCSGQSNMDMALGGCNRKEDVDSADLPGIRSFRVPLRVAGTPLKTLPEGLKWTVCSPMTAGNFSAVGFYFARKIYQENKAAIPIGLMVSSVGGTCIDVWLAPEGLVDIPELKPLLNQPVLPSGPFHLNNGMIHPLAPYGIKGALWYQGENAEMSTQSAASYYLKMKALVQGWQRLWGMDELPFYYVMIANWGELPKDATPVLASGGWNAGTRLQQVNAMALPHAGCASAIDIGDSSMGDQIWAGWHPKDKLDVGERLALWALKNDYGHPALITSGPVLKDVLVSGDTVECSFDFIGGGLMVGAKEWYQPTKEVADGALQRFVIAGSDGKWHPAKATIKDNKVLVSSPSVAEPRKVSYACWQNPVGCNLYNKEGLPAAPFHVDDLTKRHSISATAGEGGSIIPAGTRPILRTMTALYEIKPKPGYFVQDVKVDGVSVGSVEHFTFDPVDADHKIEASFVRSAPTYQIAVSGNEGGSIVPSATGEIPQGGARTFAIVPKPGMLTKSLEVDGISVGPRQVFSFNDVRRNHTLAATFACNIAVSAGFGGSISPCSDVMVSYNDKQTFDIGTLDGYSIASVMVDGKDMGAKNSYTFDNVTTSHSIAVKFKGAPAPGKIPRADQLVLACLGESLPAKGSPGKWPALFPAGASLTPIATPTPVVIDGRKYSRNQSLDGDGFNFKSYTEPIACQGASVVVVARPVRNGAGSGWVSIVDVFFDRLVLGVRNDSGSVCVRRNGPIDNSKTAIPDGQITVLSLIVQPDGKYKVYANGKEIMENATASALTSLVPGEAGFAKSITVGRNAPDSWSTYNGDIGDVFLYKVALTDAERQELEAYIMSHLSGK